MHGQELNVQCCQEERKRPTRNKITTLSMVVSHKGSQLNKGVLENKDCT